MLIGYRKLSVACVALLGTMVLMYFGKITDGVYSTIVCATVVTYLGASVTQKLQGSPK